MKTKRNLGIYMDHSRAILMELSGNIVGENQIKSEFSTEGKGSHLKKLENSEHDIDLRLHSNYFKEIGQSIKDFENILLFGPTDVQTELLNFLNDAKLTKNVNFEVRKTELMAGTQMRSYVRTFFKEVPVPADE